MVHISRSFTAAQAIVAAEPVHWVLTASTAGVGPVEMGTWHIGITTITYLPLTVLRALLLQGKGERCQCKSVQVQYASI